MVKRTLLAGATMIALTGMADAADMAVKARPAPQDIYATLPGWTGWYMGGQVGYGWDWSGVDLTSNSTSGAFTGTSLQTLGSAPQGFTGGVKLGYDAQVGNLVLGIVTDINGANFTAGNGSTTTTTGPSSANPATPLTTLNSLAHGATTNWWGTTNGRLGLAGFGNHILPYVTGGLAYGGTKATFNAATATTGSVTASASDFSLANAVSKTSVGWNIGAGIETRIDRNWAFFIEGKYIDLGSVQVPLTVSNSANKLVLTSDQKFQFGVVEGGFHYRF